MTKEQLIEEARERLRGIASHLVEKFGAEEVASIWLVQALAIMALDKGSPERVAHFLRDLATEVEETGNVEAIAPKYLN